jgi:predicted RNA binding protein YcfA (HicA-like mRNA interferase family)
VPTVLTHVHANPPPRTLGWEAVRGRGSHIRLRHPERRTFLVVPLHRELKRGTLRGILRDADLSVDELRDVL